MFEVRPIRESDIARLAATRFGDPLNHRSWLTAQAHDKAVLLVADSPEGISGHIGISWTGSYHRHLREHFPTMPEIQNLRVAKHHENQGIAKRLLWEAEALVAQRGSSHVGLCVAETNERALRIYKRSGYEVANVRPFISDKNETPQTVVFLTKQVTREADHTLDPSRAVVQSGLSLS